MSAFRVQQPHSNAIRQQSKNYTDLESITTDQPPAHQDCAAIALCSGDLESPIASLCALWRVSVCHELCGVRAAWRARRVNARVREHVDTLAHDLLAPAVDLRPEPALLDRCRLLSR